MANDQIAYLPYYPQPCPTCGRCPTCGNSPQWYPVTVTWNGNSNEKGKWDVINGQLIWVSEETNGK